MDEHIGKFSIEIAPDALREIITSGRLSEFADKVAVIAASEVNAQLVDAVSKAALEPKLIAHGFAGGFTAVFEGGDFGTVPHFPPRGPKGPRPLSEVTFTTGLLTRTVALEGRQAAG